MEENFPSAKLLAVFKEEAQDYLTILNKELLGLENTPAQPSVIDELFRVAHTLKGALGLVGLTDIQDTAHRLENLFSKMKSGETKATTPIIDEALTIVDAIATPLNALWENQSSAKAAPAPPEEYIRIPAERIDTLLNLVGELLIYKAENSDYEGTLRNWSRQARTSQQKLHEVGERIQRLLKTHPQEAKETEYLLHPCQLEAEHWKNQTQALEERIVNKPMHLDSLMEELQFRIKQLRMLPCATIFDGLERLVRDIAQQEQKKVILKIEGGQTELDKKVLEGIKPCLIHLLRNAVDHGIERSDVRAFFGKPETGTIHLRAYQHNNKVFVDIQDDGAGIDLQKIKDVARQKQIIAEKELAQMDDSQLMDLIFTSGFSTRTTVTGISGRGVGMDVVRQEVEQLKGQVLVHSAAGEGTRITLELPLTVAILKALVVDVHGQPFGIPAERIEEIVSVRPEDVQSIGHRPAVQWRDRTTPLVHVGHLLGLAPLQEPETTRPSAQRNMLAVIASYGAKRVAFQIDGVRGEEEIFLKSVDPQLGTLAYVAGATLLGNGDILIVLNVTDMIQAAQNVPVASVRPDVNRRRTPIQILIVEDSLTSREMERTILESHGYSVQTAVDGLDALEKLSQKKVDLVVSDVEMPRMGGFDFCRALRKRPQTKDIPLIFITALDKEEEKRQGIEAGAQAYIVKGRFEQNHLLETIERLVA